MAACDCKKIGVRRNPEMMIGLDRFNTIIVLDTSDNVLAAYEWLKDRVKGSDDGTIPAIPLKEPLNAQNLVENLSVLDDRYASVNLFDENGNPLDDGISVQRIIGDNNCRNKIHTIKDDNIGWISINGTRMHHIFPNLKNIYTGVREITQDVNSEWNVANQRDLCMFIYAYIDHFEAPYLEYIGTDKSYTSARLGRYTQLVAMSIGNEIIHLPRLQRIYTTTSGSADVYSRPVLGNCPNAKKILLPSLVDIRASCSAWISGAGTLYLANAPQCIELITNIRGSTNRNNANATGYQFINAPILRKFVLGGVLSVNNDHGLFNTNSTDLIHLEIGGANCSLFMQDWNPTNALRTDTNAEDYIDLREDITFANNLDQFLYNFQTYIADRLEDRTGKSALTLTLSTDVYAALEAQDEQTILATLTNKNWTVTTA